MLINVDYNVPRNCKDCKFCLTGYVNWGRLTQFHCMITNVGDVKYSVRSNEIQKKMREACPFLK